jgi:hypothetical protein
MTLINEAVKFANISATTATFSVLGGYYNVAAVATWGGGSAKLEYLMPDGSTFVEYASSSTSFTANGQVNVYLPPGQYKWVIATATAIYLDIVRIPLN